MCLLHAGSKAERGSDFVEIQKVPKIAKITYGTIVKFDSSR